MWMVTVFYKYCNISHFLHQNFLVFDYIQNNQKYLLDYSAIIEFYLNFVEIIDSYLYTAPLLLILVLNRGTRIQFKIKLEFYTELNLSNFIQARPNNENIIYDLIGVVTHMGESGSSGHFIATCKSPIDNLWYQYNDDLVFRVDNFTNQILNYAMPYILFYQKKP